MMYFLVFVGFFNLIFVDCEEQNVHGRLTSGAESRNGMINLSGNKAGGHNMTYIEKAENILLIPSIQNEEHKHKKHYKKSPKRTIQKIIKKSKSKKKYNLYQISSTTSPKVDEVYPKDELARIDEGVTGQPNQRKKPRKYNPKVARYPTFKYQGKKDYRRMKRDTKREDVYILNDFDEMEFLKANGDYDVVKAKVQKYW